MGNVPEVPVAGVALAHRPWKIDAVRLAVFNLCLAAVHLPLVRHTPRCDHLDVRSEGFDAELEPDLIVALAGCAMTDGDGVLLAGDLDELLGNCRTRHRGTEQVAVLIDSACLHTRHNEVIAEVVDNVFNVKLGGSAGFRAFFQPVEFLFLTDVHAAADDLVVKCLLQPRNHGCGIQTA